MTIAHIPGTCYYHRYITAFTMCDPAFGAVNHPVIAIFFCHTLHIHGIRAGIGLCKSPGTNPLRAGQFGHGADAGDGVNLPVPGPHQNGRFAAESERRGLTAAFPSLALSTDNAAMIAAAAWPKFLTQNFAPEDLTATPQLRLG